MEVITITSEAYEGLIEELAMLFREKMNQPVDIWITKDEAKALLGISSDTTLGKLKSEGKIRYTTVSDRIHLFDRESITDFLNNQAKPVRHGKY